MGVWMKIAFLTEKMIIIYYNPVDFVVITLSSDRPPYMLSNQGCQQIYRKERGLPWFHIYPNDGCWIEWGNSWLVIRLSTSKDGGTCTWGFKRNMSILYIHTYNIYIYIYIYTNATIYIYHIYIIYIYICDTYIYIYLYSGMGVHWRMVVLITIQSKAEDHIH